ncbi:hypothetical protein VP01_2158g1 [Puccinia sorghi]|uniref:Uncharacterized protein n=1 Tax=Puccinia sorghi TaxID=27349 RepID=A0A0L6V9Q6_9BASI|nr:hypothetical protein VP01_2158g1 [Puccinia sorghi]
MSFLNKVHYYYDLLLFALADAMRNVKFLTCRISYLLFVTSASSLSCWLSVVLCFYTVGLQWKFWLLEVDSDPSLFHVGRQCSVLKPVSLFNNSTPRMNTTVLQPQPILFPSLAGLDRAIGNVIS